MKIETIFNVNDNVWFIHESKAKECKVHSLKVDVSSDNSIEVSCFLRIDTSFTLIKEGHLYRSREELIAQL